MDKEDLIVRVGGILTSVIGYGFLYTATWIGSNIDVYGGSVFNRTNTAILGAIGVVCVVIGVLSMLAGICTLVCGKEILE